MSEPRSTWAPRISPLRRLWSSFFRALSRIAYVQARNIITLSDVNRVKQIADGAPPEKIEIVPNGVALKSSVRPSAPPEPPAAAGQAPAAGDGVVSRRRRSGCGSASSVGWCRSRTSSPSSVPATSRCNQVDLEARVIGPAEEDPDYAARCRQLVARLGRTNQIQFVGPHAADRDLRRSRRRGPDQLQRRTAAGDPGGLRLPGVPVVATDVGACREMIEGRTAEDRAMGPSGFVTRVAAPKETAAALVRLARDVPLRWRMGAAGHQRVTAFYQRHDMLSRYRALYNSLIDAPEAVARL